MRCLPGRTGLAALGRLPAYAPELNPVELLWSSLKKRELTNLAGDHLADVADATERGIHRINHIQQLPWSFLPRPHRPDHPPATPTELTRRSVELKMNPRGPSPLP
ncbi:transposase [Streptomyces sp. NBC_01005]|uniref:transposase n=1 Tax=unclassified Streptomyces TaxID=2593676 RepID=UPI002E352F95|nr:transposase [Streptomyces sp. NBC_01362]WSW02942.1 transposase [Streptomyces sp. NBC_01005]WTC92448.1 transposase [Streptomyces sp. NBC_01650]